jgi:succinoglycan biosynthesis transport protein ExoP
MELIKLYNALLRRKWLIIQAVVFFTIVGIVLALILPKNYQSTARVMVTSSDSTMSILAEMGLSEVATSLSSSDDDISNIIALATTRTLLDDLIWRLQLRNSDGKLYSTEELLVPGLLGEFEARPNLSVTQEQGTDILMFEASSDDPRLSQLIADTAVTLAVKRSQERSREDTRAARIFIEKQLKDVEKQFDDAMGAIASAQADEEILDLESEMKAAIARLSEQMLSFETNAASIQEVRAKLRSQRSYSSAEATGRVSSYARQSNSKILSIENSLLELREGRARMRLELTEKHPDIIEADKMITELEEQLDAAIAEQQATDPNTQQLQSQLAGLIQRGEQIQSSIDANTELFGGYPEKMRRLSQLTLIAGAAEKVYESLQEQRYQIGVAEAMQVSDLQPIEAAVLPDRHYSPKLLVNVILGIVLGTGVGLGLAFVFEYIDDSVKNPDELAELWGLPQLGIVPRFKISGERRVIDVLPTTHPISEAYRTVRNGLLYASLDKPLRIIATSSAMPGEGKSTFSINLAISFALEGKRVLLVDCDLRRPAQHRHFPETSNHQGLTDVLTGKLGVEDAIQTTPIENLALLTSGPIPTDPARLIESLRLRQLLLDLQKSYDLVIVDTPPSLVVNDALVISRFIDGIVLVVEAGKTSRKLISDMRDRFEASGVEPLGLVLNKLDLINSSYGYYYRAYQNYKADEPAPTPRSSGGAA